MNFLENINAALRSVRSNMTRAVLTMLIIATGIMALVGILTAIDSIIYSMSSNFSSLGANSFSISPAGSGIGGNRNGRRAKRGEPITFRQAMKFKDKFAFPADVALSLRCRGGVELKHQSEKTNPNVSLQAIDDNYMDAKGLSLALGRQFTKSEVFNGDHKVIIGQSIVKKLFDGKKDKALGKVISVGSTKYKVIGVTEEKGSAMGNDQDNVAYIPLNNGKRYYGTAKTNYAVTVDVHDGTKVDQAEAVAIGMFRNIRGLKLSQENDFKTFKSDGLQEIIRNNTKMLQYGTIAIASLTLFGAAIGLMNIMLVSVTERTREIGVHKALGATQRNILVQFLTEAVVICQMGGLIGIILGILIGNGVALATGGAFIIPWPWIFLGITLCMAVGLLSGLYPAMRAAKLDPIESLRYE